MPDWYLDWIVPLLGSELTMKEVDIDSDSLIGLFRRLYYFFVFTFHRPTEISKFNTKEYSYVLCAFSGKFIVIRVGKNKIAERMYIIERKK